MVLGESGLGKATLVNSLFLTDLYPERHIFSAQGWIFVPNQSIHALLSSVWLEKVRQSVKIEASTVEIEERGVKVRLTVVDTPGYGDSINTTDCYKSILNYIDTQFERYLNDESGLNRRNISDNRVHCLFYFISPFTRGYVSLTIPAHLLSCGYPFCVSSLKPLDIECMKALHQKVNIVPIIAKADALTQEELAQMKQHVRMFTVILSIDRMVDVLCIIDPGADSRSSYSNLSNTWLWFGRGRWIQRTKPSIAISCAFCCHLIRSNLGSERKESPWPNVSVGIGGGRKFRSLRLHQTSYNAHVS